MINIAILLIVAVLATALAGVYLSYQEGNLSEDMFNESDSGVQSNKKSTVVLRDNETVGRTLSGKRIGFLLLMAIMLCVVAVFLVEVYQNNTLVDNLKLIVLLVILFIAANTDARQRIIPNTIVIAGLVLRIVFWCVELITVSTEFWYILKNDLMACLMLIAFFVVGVLMVKGGIGMGDIKLMLVMCLFQGFYGVVSSLFCSLFVAFLYAIVVLVLRKKTRKDSVAFAPAILVGTILSVFLTGM